MRSARGRSRTGALDPGRRSGPTRNSLRAALREHPGTQAALAAQGLFVDSRPSLPRAGQRNLRRHRLQRPRGDDPRRRARVGGPGVRSSGSRRTSSGLGGRRRATSCCGGCGGDCSRSTWGPSRRSGARRTSWGRAADIEPTSVRSMVLAGMRKRLGRRSGAPGRQRHRAEATLGSPACDSPVGAPGRRFDRASPGPWTVGVNLRV